MKLFTGWVMSAGLVLAAATAHAQGAAPGYTAVSDISGPYAAAPPEVSPAPVDGPRLLPPREVYTVVRESGFSPLGIPRQHGLYYTIAVLDRRGDDGRLVIDARTGQIVRFVPGYPLFGRRYEDAPRTYAPAGPLLPMTNLRDAPRPPAEVPRVASRMPPTVPMPKAAPPRENELKPLADKPVTEPVRQSAAVQAKPADSTATPLASPSVVEAKPAAAPIQPTREMPKMQGLE
jgi:hypothetical protein